MEYKKTISIDVDGKIVEIKGKVNKEVVIVINNKIDNTFMVSTSSCFHSDIDHARVHSEVISECFEYLNSFK